MADTEDVEESLFLHLSNAGKYSYVSLCATVLASQCDIECDSKWCEDFIKANVKRLGLPQQVLSSVLMQFRCHDQSESSVYQDTEPLIQTLRDELTNFEGGEKVILITQRYSISHSKENLDLLNLALLSGEYDARARVLIYTIARLLSIHPSKINEYEDLLVHKLKYSEKDETSEEQEVKRKKKLSKKRKKALLIGLGAVGGGLLIGLTGGLAAPLVATGVGAVIGGGSAAVLGSTAGIALITSIFGATGAGLTGYRMSRRVGDVEEFAFEILNKEEHLHVTIAISGWLTDNEDDTYCGFKDPWRALCKSKEQYCLRWESRYLIELGEAISSLLTSSGAGMVVQEALKYTILKGIMTAIAWPVALLQLGYLIDNPWNVCSHRAAQVGKHLADVLLSRQQGRRPLTLIGFSLGARVIFFCLEALAKKGGMGIIEDAVLLGAPVSADEDDWKQISKVVAGRVVNGYCRHDWLLKFVYRAVSVQSSIAGLKAVKCEDKKLTNVDLEDVVDGHMDYADPDKMSAILELVGVETKKPSPRNDTEHLEDDKKLIEDSARDEAFCVVEEILEDRIDVALAVSAINKEMKERVESAGHLHEESG